MLAIVLLNAAVDAWRAPTAHASAIVVSNPSRLELHAKLNAQQLEVSWDHESAVIQQADRGSLQILDGGVTESVPFEASQLQDGILVYRPRTNDVSVRMEVNERDGQVITESVRAVAAP